MLELFATKGYGQVSLRKVAAELELTVGTLYHHCSGKEDLLFEFLEEHYLAMLKLFRPARKSPSVRYSLNGVLDGLIQLFERNPLYFQLAVRDRHCLHGAHCDRIDDLRGQIAAGLAETLQDTWKVQEHQVFRGSALAIFEQMPLWAGREEPCGVSRHRLFERLLFATLTEAELKSDE